VTDEAGGRIMQSEDRWLLRFAIALAILIIIFFGQALLAGTQSEQKAISPAEVRSGSLLIRTSQPGAFLPAPRLSTDVRIRVTGIIARTEVVQRFENPAPSCVEAVYVFPLPETAAVDRLRLTIGQRVVEGEIRERGEAQATYQRAKSAGKKAALLEQERPNIFTASVASLGAGEHVEVSIAYQETVRYDSGLFRLRFPMVVGPRYIPGTRPAVGSAGSGRAANTDRVPDAERITPPVFGPEQGSADPVRLTVDLDAGVPMASVTSSYHDARVDRVAPEHAVVALGLGAALADRDFELVWRPETGSNPAAAVFAEQKDGEAYALLMVVPPETGAEDPSPRLARESIFVIDTSGSMAGSSIEQARLALDAALSSLRPEDTFNVIEFNSQTRALYPAPHTADPDSVGEARRFVAGLRADGGTEMLPALAAALGGAPDASRVRQVIFVTDGCVGNEEELLTYIHAHLSEARLFTVGIGSAPNSHFMRKTAEFGRGGFSYIGDRSEVAEKMGNLFRKLGRPVLHDIRVDWPDVSAESFPARVPDLYAGEPLVAVARLSGLSGAISFSGERAGGRLARTMSLSGGGPESGIDALWARRKIAALTDSLAEGADVGQVRSKVVEVALAHHLVSDDTSLVAVDLDPNAAATACTTVPVPVRLPAGWQYGEVFGVLPQTATPRRLLLLAGAIALAAGVLTRRLSA
jgi:Ca-activated chloride channel homolog